MNEQAIIQGCLQKNPLNQRELYNHFSPKMLSVCYRFSASRDDAEDMLQEGFIRMFSQLHSYSGGGAFEGWVRRIFVNTCINFLKKHKRFNNSIDIEYAGDISAREESFASIMQGRQVMDCIRQLPLGYRTVLNLYAIEGYSHKEIGKMLEIGESTSRSQYTRAKTMLEKLLIKREVIEKPKVEAAWFSPIQK